MGLQVDVSGTRVFFEDFLFKSEEEVFRSSINNAVDFSLDVKTRFKKEDEVNKDDYLIFFFVKKELAENDIFQVFDEVRRKRIGWCFPVNSINSGEHDYASNEHFRRYAFSAMLKILNELPAEIFIRIPTLRDGVSINISDVMHESTAALVISKSTLSGAFEVDRWLPSMAAKGYFLLSSSNPDLLQVSHPRISSDRLNILEVSQDVDQLERLRLVYFQAFPYEPNVVFRFFYLYQVVEHLMEIIFVKEQAKIVEKLMAAARDTSATKDILEGIGRNSSEKSRIKLMIGDYSNTDSDLSPLLASCNSLLIGLGRKEGNTFDKTIYPTRNQIVHRLVDFPDSQIENMKVLTNEFIGFLSILLSKFKIPVVVLETEE